MAPPSRDVMLMRLDQGRAIGLTYEEYKLEILERGRHLQAGRRRANRRDQGEAAAPADAAFRDKV